MNTSLSLIIDDRERAIIPFLEAENPYFPLIVKRITVGDYAIADGDKLIAVIERKSLADFGASLKDGRYHNKEDLIAARKESGCKCIYIIEGPLVNKPSNTFGGIPYDRIESAINHLMLRDDVMIVNTANQLHTAKRLISLVKSAATLQPSKPLVVAAGATSMESMAKSLGGAATPAPVVPAFITTIQPTSDEVVVKNMWATLRGVSSISAEVFMDMSIADIIDGTITIEQLKTLKINHRQLGKQTLTSLILLATGDKDIESRLLAEIPGISVATAKVLVTGRTLKEILATDVPSLSLLVTGKNKLGIAKSSNIHKYFKWKRCLPVKGSEQPSTHIPTHIPEIPVSSILNSLSSSSTSSSIS